MTYTAGKFRKVIEAPPWLVKCMKTLRQMPPPTLQEVETQLKASEETMTYSTGKFRRRNAAKLHARAMHNETEAWAKMIRSMTDEQRTDYLDYLRQCGYVPMSTIKL